MLGRLLFPLVRLTFFLPGLTLKKLVAVRSGGSANLALTLDPRSVTSPSIFVFFSGLWETASLSNQPATIAIGCEMECAPIVTFLNDLSGDLGLN